MRVRGLRRLLMGLRGGRVLRTGRPSCATAVRMACTARERWRARAGGAGRAEIKTPTDPVRTSLSNLGLCAFA